MNDPNIVDEPEDTRIERHASWTELFFDLVVVAGVAALAHVLGSELDPAALGLYALLFLAFCCRGRRSCSTATSRLGGLASYG